jgi:inhibitor of cysteine peptidase
MIKRLAGLLAGAFVLASIPFLMATGTISESEVAAADKDGLPVIGSYQNLKKLLKKDWDEKRHFYGAPIMESALASQPAASQAKSADSSGGSSVAYSATNTQVQGVDEADIVKTDGTYIYQATQQEVRIVKAYPAASMQVSSRITYDNGRFQPLEMYVDENRVVVIGQAYETYSTPPSASSKHGIPRYHDKQTVKVMIYDISDKKHPRLERQLDVEGNYLSSRKIGASLYLTSNNYMDAYRILEEKAEVDGPVFRDSSQGDQYLTVPYSDIRYFPERVQPNYLMVAGVNLDNPKQKMSVHTYLGGGENIYASLDNFYVAVTEYEALPYADRPAQSFAPAIAPLPDKSKTTIYRFAMNKGTLSFSGKGTVPGRILNQFSIDEHERYVRMSIHPKTTCTSSTKS